MKQYFVRVYERERAVNRHSRRVWGSENPRDVAEYERDSLKISVWCAFVKHKVTGPIFFEEPLVTGDTFLTLVENSALRHVPVGTVFQSNGATLHSSHLVHAFLDREFSDR
jgi:hypothetical protein